ncbi:MAG: methylenetetrahydrofolate reductase C-terminal domain-containing protein [Oscillospiraceae bacterium]|nr:methylenetetrahydrofolate reductase C-terminal domain-containing protein [Oscillospiraceae bacterium]
MRKTSREPLQDPACYGWLDGDWYSAIRSCGRCRLQNCRKFCSMRRCRHRCRETPCADQTGAGCRPRSSYSL